MRQNAFSSVGRSVAAYYPQYAPPEANSMVATNIQGSSVLASVNPPVHTPVSQSSACVSSRFSQRGEGMLYHFAPQFVKWFRETMTGGVESTQFQPRLNYTLTGNFNSWLYRACGGYPQNLGFSEKVPSIPNEVRTSTAWGRMNAAPQFKRNVFTRRSYSNQPPLPAKPQYG